VLAAVLRLLRAERPDIREMGAATSRNLALTEIGRGALVKTKGLVQALLACLMHAGRGKAGISRHVIDKHFEAS
jgi:hypothetical protein